MAPPHGGLAIGIDRLAAIILDALFHSRRNCISKNRVAYCPLTKAPNYVDVSQLDDLNIQHKTPVEDLLNPNEGSRSSTI